MKIKSAVLSLSLLSCAVFSQAHAEQIPATQGYDARVQVFNYDPSDVFVINARVGHSTLIQFEEGEAIHEEGGLGMGDAKAWSLAVKGNNIFFKPVTDLPDTNMLIVTNKRTYAFQLTTGGASPTYIARFNYPEENIQNPSSAVTPASLKAISKDANGRNILVSNKINVNYSYRGSRALKPTNTWDDGRFTYLQFAHSSDLPAVYRVLEDNTEALVNTHVKDDVLVIQEVGNVYRLRFGKSVGDISNSNYKLPDFNKTGTSDNNYIRTNQ